MMGFLGKPASLLLRKSKYLFFHLKPKCLVCNNTPNWLLSGSVLSDRARLCWKCGPDKLPGFPARLFLHRQFSLSTFSGPKTDRFSVTPGKCNGLSDTVTCKFSLTHKQARKSTAATVFPSAVLQVCATFWWHADHQLSEGRRRRPLHMHGLHAAAAGAKAAAAKSPKWVFCRSVPSKWTHIFFIVALCSFQLLLL